MAVTGLPAVSAEQAVLSVTLMCARTHCPASQPGVLQLPGMAVTGLPALSTEQAVLSGIGVCWVTHTPASQPGVLQAPGMAVTGLPAVSAEQAVLSRSEERRVGKGWRSEGREWEGRQSTDK